MQVAPDLACEASPTRGSPTGYNYCEDFEHMLSS